MTFLKISTKDVDVSEGIVYLLVIWLDDGTEVYKIGVTKRTIQERVCEILSSYWVKYRVFPKCYPKRYKTTDRIYEKESAIHKELSDYSYAFDKKFGGSTEFFSGIELEKVVEIYERIVNDNIL